LVCAIIVLFVHILVNSKLEIILIFYNTFTEKRDLR